ncbi:hypothetical protein HDK77DRAFT_494529 [Phyllosticta capitalensis]
MPRRPNFYIPDEDESSEQEPPASSASSKVSLGARSTQHKLLRPRSSTLTFLISIIPSSPASPASPSSASSPLFPLPLHYNFILPNTMLACFGDITDDDEEIKMPFTAINDVKTESDDDTDAMTPRKRITTHESLSPITPTPSKRVASLDLNEVESPVKRTKGRLTPPPMLNAETPRQRSTPKKVSAPKAIATSLDQLSMLDRTMVQMKDAGKGWKEINAMWEKETGDRPAKSTLPNRYSRLMANLTSIPEDDQAKLAEAKAFVEQDFAKTKWERIGQRMRELGVENRYATTVLQKQWEKMEQAAARAAKREDDICE